MANNQHPWMKHDHNARNDLFIKKLEAKFGHFGYSGFFKLLEVLHEQGSGDNLCITKAQLALELRSKWPTVHLLLTSCRDSGKVHFDESGQDVTITVKNFRKKQDKKKSKTEDVPVSDESKRALDVDVEGEVDKDKKGFLEKLKRLAGGFRVTPWTASELEKHQFPFGKERGRRAIDMEPVNCQFYLDNISMDSKTTAAMKHRIKIKQAEEIRR